LLLHLGEYPMPSRTDAKRRVLLETGSFNAHSEAVQDPLFQQGEFFDGRDLVQVKYEMLRRVEQDGQLVTETAETFGFSRVAFYQTQATFRQQGLRGLIRKRPGPHGAHKLTAAVMEFIDQQLAEDDSLRARDLAERVRKKFDFSVHPRSIERALARRQKKGR
jgi:transposase